jgi:hypothetical protein
VSARSDHIRPPIRIEGGAIYSHTDIEDGRHTPKLVVWLSSRIAEAALEEQLAGIAAHVRGSANGMGWLVITSQEHRGRSSLGRVIVALPIGADSAEDAERAHEVLEQVVFGSLL